MSSQIGEETMLIVMSIYGGLVLIICYDLIRIFRRIFPAKLFRVIVEDVIYWTAASIFMFQIFLKYNYGMPRFFSVVMVLGTMAMFEWFIGRHFINRVSKILHKIIIFLAKPLKKTWKVVKLLFYKGNKNIIKIKERKNAGREQKKGNHKVKHHKRKKNKK
jgi:spore cortex biosynthesis protein YabQ